MAETCQVNRVSVCHVFGLISITCYPFFTGVTALATAIPDMGALTSLNMSKNRIKGAEAGKALGDALAGNTVLKELDISGDKYGANMDIGFVKAFTPGLCDNGAMTSLNLFGNELGAEGAKHLAAGIKVSKCVIAVVLAPFSCRPSDHWLNCCCLLLSTG